jgi:two-component system phosphate regulon response regulator PhoB
VRSVLYRFPDLEDFERVVLAARVEAELGVPPGETVDDGEWVLAIFELGPGRRATSAAGRGTASPEGARLVFEPRDIKRLADFASHGRAGERQRGLSDVFSFPQPPDLGPDGDARPTSDRSPSGPPAHLSHPSRPSRPSMRAVGADPRVIIVDDDPDIREVVSVMLEAVGLRVVAVESGEDALLRLAQEPFDLMVVDWNLPRMTGLDLCRALRRDPAQASLPVLFLTANASSQDMVEAFASGGDDYVVKPFRAPELGARIFSLLRRARKAGGPAPTGSTPP